MKTNRRTNRLYVLHRKHERLWWMVLFALGVLATCILAYSLGAGSFTA